jgi:hypothetical protein
VASTLKEYRQWPDGTLEEVEDTGACCQVCGSLAVLTQWKEWPDGTLSDPVATSVCCGCLGSGAATLKEFRQWPDGTLTDERDTGACCDCFDDGSCVDCELSGDLFILFGDGFPNCAPGTSTLADALRGTCRRLTEIVPGISWEFNELVAGERVDILVTKAGCRLLFVQAGEFGTPDSALRMRSFVGVTSCEPCEFSIADNSAGFYLSDPCYLKFLTWELLCACP